MNMNQASSSPKKTISRDQILSLRDTSYNAPKDLVIKLKKLGIYSEYSQKKSPLLQSEPIPIKFQRKNTKKSNSSSLESAITTSSPQRNTSSLPVTILRKNSKIAYRFVEAKQQGQEEQASAAETKRLEFEKELDEQRRLRQKQTLSAGNISPHQQSTKMSTSPLQQLLLESEMKKQGNEEIDIFINQFLSNITKHRSNSFKSKFEEHIEKSTSSNYYNNTKTTVAGEWYNEEELLVFPLFEDDDSNSSIDVTATKNLRHTTESFEDDTEWMKQQPQLLQNWQSSPVLSPQQPTAGSASPPTLKPQSYFQNDVPYHYNNNSTPSIPKKKQTIAPPSLIPIQSLYNQPLKLQPKQHAVVQ